MLNRANRRMEISHKDADYEAFERVLTDAVANYQMGDTLRVGSVSGFDSGRSLIRSARLRTSPMESISFFASLAMSDELSECLIAVGGCDSERLSAVVNLWLVANSGWPPYPGLRSTRGVRQRSPRAKCCHRYAVFLTKHFTMP